jgi:peptidoglycan/xylan/chitin deacetylase (PgdA/CDA1 family)
MKSIKRLITFFAAFLYIAITSLSALPARAAEPNLIQNPSAETAANATTPSNWMSGNWGTNTSSFTYAATGHTGSKSLQVNVTSYTNGDAKWSHDAVSVTPGKTYDYSDYYKSTVSTELVAQYADAAGNFTYAYLDSVDASATWATASTSFTVPANAVKVTVFHLIAAVGSLTIDDASIALQATTTPPPPTAGNLISNESFETASGGKPAGWLNNKWGTNTSTLTYENTGRTGNRSVKATVTQYTNGDAKWYAEAVTVTAGKMYTYSDYYKATVTTRLVAAYTTAAGTTTYATLSDIPAAADWTQYSTDFTVPSGITKVSLFHLIDSVGNLTIDDVSLIETATTPPVDTENLIANNSLETANGGQPVKWVSNKWGTNTTIFTYENTGRTGSRSVKATVSAYTSGDAKWYAEAVTVTPGKAYLYRDYYKSTVATGVVAQYTSTTGTITYAELPSAPAAADWTQYSTTLTIPANVTKVSIFHLLGSVGSLTIDDVELVVAAPSSATIPANGSVETGGTTPTGWSGNKWGNNTTAFQYVTNEGYTGSRSIKVTMSNYVDGDAKWFFEPVTSLTPGKQYRFTVQYKGTAMPHATAMYMNSAGVESYVGLPSPQTISATTWTRYSDTFTVPEGVTQVSLFMFINTNGWLQTDDYSIADYHPNGFNRPLLTLTFDDGHEDNATTALPLLNQYGFKSTQCYATNFIEGQSQAVIQGVLDFYNSGHEICSHTVSHPFLTTLNDTDLNYELQHSKQYLESLIGAPVRNFATPYGDYNAHVNDIIDNYYQSHRTVDEGFNSKDNFNIYRLRVQNILDTTTAAQVRAWIEQAQADKTWLILVYHRVADNPGPYDTYTNIFAEQLQVIQQSGITVKTYQDALTEVRAQL